MFSQWCLAMVVQDNFGGCIYQLSNSNHGAKNNVPHPMSPPIHSNVFHYILLFGVDITTQRLYKNATLYRTKSNVAFKTHKSFRQRYLLAACPMRCLLALITLSHVIANASRHCATVFLILFIFTMPFPLQAAKKL